MAEEYIYNVYVCITVCVCMCVCIMAEVRLSSRSCAEPKASKCPLSPFRTYGSDLLRRPGEALPWCALRRTVG